MPHTCAVIGCTNRSGREKKNFYNVPAIIKHQGEQTEELSIRRRREWIAAIDRKEELPKSSKICSDHFISGKPAALFDVKNEDWVPSRYMKIEKRKKSQCSLKAPSKKKTISCSLENGSAIREQCAAAIDLLHFANGTTSSDVQNFGQKRSRCSFVLKGKLEGQLHCDVDKNSLKLFGTECQQLLDENNKLKKRLFCLEMSEACFQDNKKVEYYTGLPTSRILFTVFKCVEDFIVLTGNSRMALLLLVMLLVMVQTADVVPEQGLSARSFRLSRSSRLAGRQVPYEDRRNENSFPKGARGVINKTFTKLKGVVGTVFPWSVARAKEVMSFFTRGVLNALQQ